MRNAMKSEETSGAPPGAPLRYDNTSITLHWITAVLVLLLWCAGETIDWFPRGTPRVTVRSLHILFGVALGAILCWRIWWRTGGAGRRLSAVDSGVLKMLSNGVHVALYFVLVATVILGVANAWVRGDSIFGLFSLPSFAPGNRALRGQIEDLHSWSANALLILAGLHACAGLWHHFIRKDGVLRRMWPARSN
jgi:cytochrome b561